MFHAQHSKQTEIDGTQTASEPKPTNLRHHIQRAADPTRLPLYTQAWGNLPPPWLRLPVSRQEPHEEGPVQRKENNTGLPDILKVGVEHLSGVSMDDVQVHYNSAKPAPLQALAYTQGTDIHVGPGQEMHLPHEAWHVVQQKEGRVKPTLQPKGVAMNDDAELEREADVMGERAKQHPILQGEEKDIQSPAWMYREQKPPQISGTHESSVLQRKIVAVQLENELLWYDDENPHPKFYATREEAEAERFDRTLRNAPQRNPGEIPIFDVRSQEFSSKFQQALRFIGGANIPDSLAITSPQIAKGQANAFQILDPQQLSIALYGTTEQERRAFLLIASEKRELSQRIQGAASIGEAEAIFAMQPPTDLRKAVEEALTMRALSQVNRSVTNIRRPPPEIAGKYDYLVDLPEHFGVPVDPKVVAPYIIKHWQNNKLSKAQRKQVAIDEKKGVDPELPFKVALEIARRSNADPAENYARWIVSNGQAQLHELSEVHESGEFRFKGIVVSNVAYINAIEQADLAAFRQDPRILAYYKLEKSDLDRLIEVAPTIR